MTIQIIEQTEDYIDLIVGKREFQISAGLLGNDFSLNVLCKNASNRVWRGFGNWFTTWEQALDHYKSAAAITAINHAREVLV